MDRNPSLETFWISFPQNANMPIGLGVTAFSEQDAFALIEERGFDAWYEGAVEIKVTKGVKFSDLDATNVAPNIGPMQLRGVWYPAANIGYGAPKDAAYKPVP